MPFGFGRNKSAGSDYPPKPKPSPARELMNPELKHEPSSAAKVMMGVRQNKKQEVPRILKPEGIESFGPGISAEGMATESVFRSKPEPMHIGEIVEKAAGGDALEMVNELDQYCDALVDYGQDRSLYYNSPERVALKQARSEAIRLAQEGNFDGLRAKLEQINGEIANSFEAAAEAFIKHIQSGNEGVVKQKKEELADAVDNILELQPTDILSAEVQPATQPTSVEQEQTPTETKVRKHPQERTNERESRAEKFAEKYDIAAEREALLAAEQDYATAIREWNASAMRPGLLDNLAAKEQRKAFEDALQNWREALGRAGNQAELASSRSRKPEITRQHKQDVINARFISARDTMMRMEQVRQQAVAEGLDARSKTTIGKYDAWVNNKARSGFMAFSKGWGVATEKVGSLVGGKVIERFVNKEEDFEKYQRASRMVGGALISSAIFAPAGAIAAGATGLGLAFRIGRGLFMGLGGGTAIGKLGGIGHDKVYGAEDERLEEHEATQAELRKLLKTKDISIENVDPKVLREMFKIANEREFQKSEDAHEARKQKVQMATTLLVSGLSSYEIAHWPSVHHALETVNTPPGTGSVTETQSATHVVTHPSTSAAPTPEASAPPVHIDSVSVHGDVNDADKLFGRFTDQVQKQFPDLHTAPPALRTLLEQYHHVDGTHQQDVLTNFLNLRDGGSVYVHPGDTLSFEHGKIMFQGHTLIDENGRVHNLQEEGLIRMQHPHVEHAAHATPAEHAATQPTSEQPTSAQQNAESPKIVPDQRTSAPAPAAQPEPTVTPSPTAEASTSPASPEEYTSTGPSIIPNEQSPAAPIHIQEPSPASAITPEHISPMHTPESLTVEHITPPIAPIHETVVSHPAPANDNAPASSHTEAPGVAAHLNSNGFDLAKPSVGLDSKGNLFSHIERTGNVTKDNDLAYQTAFDYATKHPATVVYYADEARTLMGQSQYQVIALKFDPGSGQVIIPAQYNNLDVLPPIPKDEELRNITS